MTGALTIPYMDTMNKSPVSNSRKYTMVSLCIYSMYDTSDPYVLYLLHKLEGSLYWPHYNTKHSRDYKSVLKQMNIMQYTYQGYVEEKDQLYVYIKLEDNFQYDKYYYKHINWFVSMNEILFSRKCWIYDIDSSVTTRFINNPLSIYVYQNDNRLDIPEVAYYPTTSGYKEYNTNIGLANNTPSGVTVYNYEDYMPGEYVRIIIFMYTYIVPDIHVGGKAIKTREIDIDKDNYEILSSHGIYK